MSSIDDLTKPLTVEEIKTGIYYALELSGVSTTTWKPGAVVRTLIAGVSIVLAGFSRLQAEIAKSGFLELAEGAWLTLVARHVYGVERDLGSFAAGTVQLDNAGGGVYSGDPGDIVLLNPTTGQTYRNTESYSIGALETGVEVAIEAVELGSDGTSGPNAITELVTPLLGVSVTNPTAIVGTDEETDAALRLRCREKTGVASPNGPRDAYAFFARSAKRADGTSVGVTRVRVVPDGAGNVNVYVATATGGVTGDVDDPDTDLGAIADAIYRNAEPLAVTAIIESASAKSIPVTYEIWLRDTTGLTDDQVKALIANALTAYMASEPIGGEIIPPATTGTVYLSAIETVIGAAVPEGALIKLVVTAPSADTALDLSEAPVLGTVTPTAVHQISGGSI